MEKAAVIVSALMLSGISAIAEPRMLSQQEVTSLQASVTVWCYVTPTPSQCSEMQRLALRLSNADAFQQIGILREMLALVPEKHGASPFRQSLRDELAQAIQRISV